CRLRSWRDIWGPWFRPGNPHAPEALIPHCSRLAGSFFGERRMLMGALVTFLVVILILYLINLLPLDGRAKQIARVVVIILGVISLLKYIAVFCLDLPRQQKAPAMPGPSAVQSRIITSGS